MSSPARLHNLQHERFYTYSGKEPVSLLRYELLDAELDIINKIPENHMDRALPALYQLYLFEVGLTYVLTPAD